MKSIVRTDLVSKMMFSKEYKMSRSKLDQIIAAGELPTEEICGIMYISIKDSNAIANALLYRCRSPQDWHKSSDYTVKPKKRKKKYPHQEFEDQMERDWRESMGIPQDFGT
jgi:hypothetical protein